MRAIPEWIAKHDDQRVPPRVQLRIFLKHNGRCHISHRKIRPGDKWELEHIIALCNGGQHRESNMAPALVAPHKVKTRHDRAEKQRADSIRRRHIGIPTHKSRPMPGSKDSPWRKRMDGTVERRDGRCS